LIRRTSVPRLALFFHFARAGRHAIDRVRHAHAVAPGGGRYKKKQVEADHWHRTENDSGRPYRLVSAEKLIDDLFYEVERVLTQRGIDLVVLKTKERKTS